MVETLSLGVRIIMIKSALNNISIYMMHLFYLPKDIIKRIDFIIARYLWARPKFTNKILLIHLEVLARHKDWG